MELARWPNGIETNCAHTAAPRTQLYAPFVLGRSGYDRQVQMTIASVTEAGTKAHGRPRDAAARARILHAALALLEESGFANMTSDAIAERAGASKATVYRWWPNKAAVVIEAFVESIMPELHRPEVASLQDFVRTSVRGFAQALMGRNGRLLRAVFHAAHDDPEVDATFQTYWVKPRRKLLRVALGQFRAEGQLDAESDIDQIVDLMYGTMQYVLIVNHRRLSLAYADDLANILLNGLLPKRK